MKAAKYIVIELSWDDVGLEYVSQAPADDSQIGKTTFTPRERCAPGTSRTGGRRQHSIDLRECVRSSLMRSGMGSIG